VSLSDWMISATKPGPFSPPGLIVAVNDDIAVCGVDGAGRDLNPETVWPLACLTKLALADSAVRFLELDRCITAWLPETGLDATVRQLLTHTAGLPLDLPSEWYGCLNRDDVSDVTLSMAPDRAPGTVAYSNIGYGWIAAALERVTGEPLSTILRAHDLVWGDESLVDPVVITDVRSPHAGTVLEPYNSPYWRSLHLPWAGAFGTVRALQHLMNRLDPRVCATRVHASGGFPQGAYFGMAKNGACEWTDAEWSCGVEHRGTKSPHWITAKASPDSFGHVGSSGMLVWKDGDTTFVLAGPRTTDGGWMLRQGPKASAFAFSRAA
jgi:hypothetical protein